MRLYLLNNNCIENGANSRFGDVFSWTGLCFSKIMLIWVVFLKHSWMIDLFGRCLFDKHLLLFLHGCACAQSTDYTRKRMYSSERWLLADDDTCTGIDIHCVSCMHCHCWTHCYAILLSFRCFPVAFLLAQRAILTDLHTGCSSVLPHIHACSHVVSGLDVAIASAKTARQYVRMITCRRMYICRRMSECSYS
jgi:hypothetical protein